MIAFDAAVPFPDPPISELLNSHLRRRRYADAGPVRGVRHTFRWLERNSQHARL